MHKYHFKKLHTPTNEIQKRGIKTLKIINNKPYRNKLQKTIEKIYGGKFRIVLYFNHIFSKDEKDIKKFMKKENFDIITFKEILNDLDSHTSKFSYSNEPIMQLLRIQKRLSNK